MAILWGQTPIDVSIALYVLGLLLNKYIPDPRARNTFHALELLFDLLHPLRLSPDLTVASWLLALVSLQQAKSPAAAYPWQNHPRLMPPMPLMPQRTLAAKFPAAWPGRVVTPPYPKPTLAPLAALAGSAAGSAAPNAGGVQLLVKPADPSSTASAGLFLEATASIETLVSPAASLLAGVASIVAAASLLAD